MILSNWRTLCGMATIALSGLTLAAGLTLAGCGAGVHSGVLVPSIAANSSLQVWTGGDGVTGPPLMLSGAPGPVALQMEAAGTVGAAHWSTAAGSLPAGVQLSDSGKLSGTIAGNFAGPVLFSVHDDADRSASISTMLSVQAGNVPLSLAQATLSPAALQTAAKSSTTGSKSSPIALQGAVLGQSYAQTLWSPAPPAGWMTYFAGFLPPGLRLSSTGLLKGTPTVVGTYVFVAANVNGSVEMYFDFFTVTVTSSAPLKISTSSLQTAKVGSAYVATLQATGGTPNYKWKVAAGTLPSGLSIAEATGVISGTPSAPITSNVQFAVEDTKSQVAQATLAVDVAAATPPESPTTPAPPTVGSGGSGSSSDGAGNTWFIRTDGGTRYDAALFNTGQCDGLGDAAYPGEGVNQHCAFNDVRYMWMLPVYGNSQWVMQGGDTLVIRGCAAMPSQQDPDAPHCRIGWDKASGNDAENFWCAGVSASWGCSMPPVPSGTVAQPTRILGACAYGTYTCSPVNTYPYTANNLTQLFAGYSSTVLMYLSGAQNVVLEGLELTTHNGQCARYGTTNPMPQCNRGATYPLSDQADQGIVTTNTTGNILLQDVYIHGFSSSGITGPIGGAVTLTRVSLDFNTFAGWNFDDGNATPNAPGSTITQSYMTMIGNGCQEEYPIVHTAFPAKGCWDSSTGGFGDAWSGQNSTLDSFTCDHCNISYNTKDGALGPHTVVHAISITDSQWVGNMGQDGKWGQDANATFLFANNLLMGNCERMSQLIPGAAMNFDSGGTQPGQGLAGYCRAAGPLFDYFADTGATVNFNNNTVVTYQPTIFEMGCRTANGCGATPYNFTNNIVLGYTSTYQIAPFNPGQAPGMYYKDDSSVTVVGTNNIEFGVKNGDICGTGGTLCVDPLLVAEPAQGTIPPEAILDGFNYHPSPSSPAPYAAAASPFTAALDFYGKPQTSPATIGAVAP